MIIFGLYKNNKLIRILVDMHNNKMKITEIDKQAFQCKHVSKVADIPLETALERSGLMNNFFDQLFDIRLQVCQRQAQIASHVNFQPVALFCEDV